MKNNNEIKSFGSYHADLAAMAQQFNEIAYLEATKPKELQNQAVINHYFKEAKRLTNRLVNAGYWKKSVILGG